MFSETSVILLTGRWGSASRGGGGNSESSGVLIQGKGGLHPGGWADPQVCLEREA